MAVNHLVLNKNAMIIFSKWKLKSISRKAFFPNLTRMPISWKKPALVFNSLISAA